MAVKKLIEVALPLEKINEESSREKSIRTGHPSTLHLWWSRKPTATARAVIWASLVDDPSSHPELFPTIKEQAAERDRLFKLLEELIIWENSNNQRIFKEAQAEILKYNNGNMPTFLDPFAGGGVIPLEAQRLGLKSNAQDLNPVAVMINKAMIEIAPRFANKQPVNSDDRISSTKEHWMGALGLASDIRYYGDMLKKEAYKHIGDLYPEVTLPKEQGSEKATVIAWIWARTVKCSNPACGCEIPLSSSFIISKKKGNEVWAKPHFKDDKVFFDVVYGKCPKDSETNKSGRSAVFRCLKCGEITTDEYVKNEGQHHRLGKSLMCVVAEGQRGRVYVAPNEEQILSAECPVPDDYPVGEMPGNPRWFSPPAFGITEYKDLFSNRQLTALTTFSALVGEIQKRVEQDAIAAGMSDDHIALSEGGTGALAYSQAITVYLSFAIDREANRLSTLCVWNRVGEKIEQVFTRQAIPMIWDYAEANIFSNSSGSWSGSLEWIPKCIETLPVSLIGNADQVDAQNSNLTNNVMISTDPPYYDMIGYADLSDYFYIWMRKNLNTIYPKIFGTVLSPKAEELIATPYRFEGDADKAKDYFEEGMSKALARIYDATVDDIPVTIYYAFKQTKTDDNNKTSSTGWETMLNAIMRAGFQITSTWPIRTERPTGLKAYENALASSIVLVCRKRPDDASSQTRRGFINELKRELRPALRNMQESNIAPVDLAQSAIGPGMSVFSKYEKVLEADGSIMTVRDALQIINEEIDVFFNEQVGELDPSSRFAVQLFTQYAFNEIKFGDAEVLANAKGAIIPTMVSRGMLYAKAGVVHLIERDKLPEKVDSNESNIWILTQQLTRAMDKGGIEACADIVCSMFGSNAERAKDLAYRLYNIAELKKWATEAYAYNSLVVAWPDIQSRAAALKAIEPKQMTLFDLQ